MNISPSSALRIVRQLSDPSDVATNYVQAVVRNSASGAVLATVNLTDEGSQRFTGTYQVGPDGSGNGFYIDVTTTVYTDSGYSTNNYNYGIESNTYHVLAPTAHVGGFGGPDLNYGKVRDIVKEELAKLTFPEIPQPKDVTPDILGAERRIRDAVASIVIPEAPVPDLEMVVTRVTDKVDEAINTLLLAVDAKEVTPATDLTEAIDLLRAIQEQGLTAILDEIRSTREPVEALLAERRDSEETVRTARDSALNVATSLSKLTGGTRQDPNEMKRARARKLLGV